MKKSFHRLFMPAMALASIFILPSLKNSGKINNSADTLVLPKGFKAQIMATDLGKTRHLTVSDNGIIYINRNKLADGKSILALKDNDHDGIIDDQMAFGTLPGTGIEIRNRYLYTSSNSSVYRYKLDKNNEVIDPEHPDLVVKGLPDHGRDNAKPFTIDKDGNLYVTIGSWNDPCRDENGNGMMPCPILDSAGGIWKFSADILNQSFGIGTRYATGVKNAVAMTWNYETNSLFAAVHGRGQFHDKYPQYYTAEQSAFLPAETLYELHEGDDAGWPYIYYDQFQKKKIQAPEYGGDGKKTGSEKAIDPLLAFPAHLGPNDILFYTGDAFPKKYKNGAFIAFHGQSPELKQGYLVAFVPFKNGKPKGKWEVFANNFAGVDLAAPDGPIQHRPCGLAQGPNGELYVCDDLGGTLFKITYQK